MLIDLQRHSLITITSALKKRVTLSSYSVIYKGEGGYPFSPPQKTHEIFRARAR